MGFCRGASIPSADLKPPADLGLCGFSLDGNDACVLGPAAQPRLELGEVCFLSAGQDLDGAVGRVPHPAAEAEAEGPLAGRGAEADTLDPPRDAVTKAGNHDGVIQS